MKSMYRCRCCLMTVVIGLLTLSGCSQESDTNGPPTVDGSKYLLKSEPEGAKDVIQIRKEAKDGDDVIIVGRIGGSKNPWIKGRAAFSIVDASLKSCKECGHDCLKPWDY